MLFCRVFALVVCDSFWSDCNDWMLKLLYLIGLIEEFPFDCYRLLTTYRARISFFLSLSYWLGICMKLKLVVLLLVVVIGASFVIAILDFSTNVYESAFGSCLFTSAELEYFSIIFLFSLDMF